MENHSNFRNHRSIGNNGLLTEPNKEDKQDAMSFYTTTERNHNSYLDYTFLSHRALIYSKQTKDPKKIRDYNYDLEKTLEINLEMLKNLTFSFNPEQNDKLKEIIEFIRQKNDQKNKNKKLIKSMKNTIVNRKQGYEELKIKIEKNSNIYDSKVEEDQDLLGKKSEYIIELKKRFKEVEKHLQYLALNGKFKRRPTRFTPVTFDFNKYIKSNTNDKVVAKELQKKLTKIAEQISDLKKENILYKEETVLYRNKTSNMQLIRVVEFYRRIIRSLQTRIKILKYAFENMTQTLHYLNLGDIVNFNMRKKDLSTTHCEIEFNDLEENNDVFNLDERLDNMMDFSIVLNKQNYKNNNKGL